MKKLKFLVFLITLLFSVNIYSSEESNNLSEEVKIIDINPDNYLFNFQVNYPNLFACKVNIRPINYKLSNEQLEIFNRNIIFLNETYRYIIRTKVYNNRIELDLGKDQLYLMYISLISLAGKNIKEVIRESFYGINKDIKFSVFAENCR